MSPAANQLFKSALGLSEDDRAELADQLWRSIDEDTQEEVAEAWAVEIKRRLEMIDRGEGHWVSEEELNRRLDAKYGRLPD
jgi:putative addiction module component (TIGR02574 family)